MESFAAPTACLFASRFIDEQFRLLAPGSPDCDIIMFKNRDSAVPYLCVLSHHWPTADYLEGLHRRAGFLPPAAMKALAPSMSSPTNFRRPRPDGQWAVAIYGPPLIPISFSYAYYPNIRAPKIVFLACLEPIISVSIFFYLLKQARYSNGVGLFEHPDYHRRSDDGHYGFLDLLVLL